jgi:hypothetical protein
MNNRIIIAGSRSFNDYIFLKKYCNFYLQNLDNITIITGCANGADKLGEKFAIECKYQIIKKPAKWEEYGKVAGYIRNKEMAKIASHAIVFWDGKSKGSKHMIDLAKEYNLKLKIIEPGRNNNWKY